MPPSFLAGQNVLFPQPTKSRYLTISPRDFRIIDHSVPEKLIPKYFSAVFPEFSRNFSMFGSELNVGLPEGFRQ